ncbi:MAG: efflux RND transporter periplasmic adaptor subunit [Pseudomonadales bacterium]
MSATQKRILLWSILGALLASALVLAFAPRPVVVDLVTVTASSMTVTVDEEAETRVREVFTLSAPVTGKLLRVEAHAGDSVVANETLLAQIQPMDPSFLDPRTESQARASIATAKSALKLAKAEVERAAAELEYAETEHERAKKLFAERTITRREADEARRIYKTSLATLETTHAALQMRQFELQRANAQLLSPTQTQQRAADCACIKATAPVSGKVLSIENPSARVVQAGEALLEIGDPDDLEIAADYLSSDAVKIEEGQRVIIDNWGGSQALQGQVQRVEPYGFTKVSALGIEEQRVNVIVDITSPPEQWARLGHGYQVETKVVLWTGQDVLTVPLTALFRDGDQWAVFLSVDAVAVLRHVQVGYQNGLVAEITTGLATNDQVIVHPSDRVVDGVAIGSRG